MNQYKVKNLAFEIKDLDSQSRRVKVALSSFDNIDSDGDIIRFGAFKKSIEERGPGSTSNRKIAFLRHHDWEHPIGVWQHLEETHDHLIGIADLGRSTKANDAFLDYQDGIIREHSIGFNFVPSRLNIITVGDQQVQEAKEVVLWEGSAVTFGANSLTPTLDVSKGNAKELLEKINNRTDALIKALKNGKGTDERLYTYEMQLRVLKEQYNSLITLEPTVKADTLKVDKPNNSEPTNQMLNFYKNLK